MGHSSLVNVTIDVELGGTVDTLSFLYAIQPSLDPQCENLIVMLLDVRFGCMWEPGRILFVFGSPDKCSAVMGHEHSDEDDDLSMSDGWEDDDYEDEDGEDDDDDGMDGEGSGYQSRFEGMFEVIRVHPPGRN